MKFHPIADIFPMLSDVELRELADDIKANGLREPIWLYEGKVLDGRNRFRACGMISKKPVFRHYTGNSPVAFVVSMNLKRRHLTASQKAACALELLPWLTIDAKKRQKLSQGRGKCKLNKVSNKLETLHSSKQAGKAMGVNHWYVEQAKAIKEKAPAEFEAIKRGEKTITKVERELKRKEIVKNVATMPSDKFRVVYADPPWKYGDGREALEGTTGASAHYPTMTISELCTIPVPNIVEDNAVLFLWVTSPLLDECWPVIKSWGFNYKTSFVWDKVKHNMGHYNSVRHEFLLVCTRGSCTPDVKELFDSVQTIERGEHSEKPEQFREIIDTIYPHGKRIELFARKKTEGWEVYGNEC